MEEDPIEEVEEWEENQFHNSGVLGLPTHSIYVPPARLARGTDGQCPQTTLTISRVTLGGTLSQECLCCPFFKVFLKYGKS